MKNKNDKEKKKRKKIQGIENSKGKKYIENTPYDDVWRTEVTTLPRLLVNFLNEMFGYEGDSRIGEDEHITYCSETFYINHTDGTQETKTVDSHKRGNFHRRWGRNKNMFCRSRNRDKAKCQDDHGEGGRKSCYM